MYLKIKFKYNIINRENNKKWFPQESPYNCGSDSFPSHYICIFQSSKPHSGEVIDRPEVQLSYQIMCKLFIFSCSSVFLECNTCAHSHSFQTHSQLLNFFFPATTFHYLNFGEVEDEQDLFIKCICITGLFS